MDAAATRLLDACPTEDVVVIGRLTDADLLALVGSEADALAPLPTLADLDATGRDLVGRTAAASVAVHGLSVDAAPGLSIEETLAGLLVLRGSPEAMVHAEQQTADVGAVLVGWVHADGRCLLEEISADGVHRFVLAPTATVVRDLVAWALPDLGEGRDGSPEDMGDDEFSVRAADLVGDAQRVTVVVGTRPRPDADPQRRVTVYERPETCVLVMRIDAANVRVVEATRERAVAVVASLLSP